MPQSSARRRLHDEIQKAQAVLQQAEQTSRVVERQHYDNEEHRYLPNTAMGLAENDRIRALTILACLKLQQRKLKDDKKVLRDVAGVEKQFNEDMRRSKVPATTWVPRQKVRRRDCAGEAASSRQGGAASASEAKLQSKRDGQPKTYQTYPAVMSSPPGLSQRDSSEIEAPAASAGAAAEDPGKTEADIAFDESYPAVFDAGASSPAAAKASTYVDPPKLPQDCGGCEGFVFSIVHDSAWVGIQGGLIKVRAYPKDMEELAAWGAEVVATLQAGRKDTKLTGRVAEVGGLTFSIRDVRSQNSPGQAVCKQFAMFVQFVSEHLQQGSNVAVAAGRGLHRACVAIFSLRRVGNVLQSVPRTKHCFEKMKITKNLEICRKAAAI